MDIYFLTGLSHGTCQSGLLWYTRTSSEHECERVHAPIDGSLSHGPAFQLQFVICHLPLL
jgi:hypothetical protein